MVPVTIWHRSGFLSNKTNEKWPRVMTVVQIGDAHLGPDRPDRSESPSAERGCGTLGQAAARSGFPPPAGRGADRAPLPSLHLRSAGLSGRGGPGPGDGDWCSGLPGRAGRSAPYIDLYRGEIPGTCSAAAEGRRTACVSPQARPTGIRTPPASAPRCRGGCGTCRRSPGRSPPPRYRESQSPGARMRPVFLATNYTNFANLKKKRGQSGPER